MEFNENHALEILKRNYYPARIKEQGDLLIVVNRGLTQIQADFDDLLPADDEADSFDSDGDGESTDETPGTWDSGIDRTSGNAQRRTAFFDLVYISFEDVAGDGRKANGLVVTIQHEFGRSRI